MNAIAPGVQVRGRGKAQALPWRRAARRRRLLLLAAVLLPDLLACRLMADLLFAGGVTPLGVAVVIAFGLIFAWISAGFWTAAAGAWTLSGRRDRFRVVSAGDDRPAPGPAPTGLRHPPPTSARTAVVVPACNEDPRRVFAGLEAMYRSLHETGRIAGFHFYVLSDSRDPDAWVEEELAWAALCRRLGEFGRIFYRRRRSNSNRKSGNVADFCRRWGSRYRYMVVLDADSTMRGSTLVRLVDAMEAHPRIGILQTRPQTVNRASFFGRLQQFANHAYGPVVAAGMHFWQLGESHYWGHNAIIRVAPFMRHCALPRLPGRRPLGGDILSHDFVEAALMGRAGYEVWLAHDLDGSYEEAPPTLLDELSRDRRWCQGNLQHLRLLGAEGLRLAHRLMFVTGALAYASAPAWLLFLLLNTLALAAGGGWFGVHALLAAPPSELVPAHYAPPAYAPAAYALLIATAILLLAPRFLSAAVIQGRGGQAQFGGTARLWGSVLLELVISSLFAPVRMLFHTRFVLATLCGRSVHWGTQHREDRETGWVEALAHHGPWMLLALAWGALVAWLEPAALAWFAPVLAPMLLAVPLSVYTSRSSAGLAARRAGLLLVPPETIPVPELEAVRAAMEQPCRQSAPVQTPAPRGFLRAVVDPYANAVHSALLRPRARGTRARARRLLRLRARALREGPGALSPEDRADLLSDAESMFMLHVGVWTLPAGAAAARWRRLSAGPRTAAGSAQTG